MASILSWVGNKVHQAENWLGNEVHGAQQAAGNAVHAVQQAPQQIQQAGQAASNAVQGAEQAVQHAAMPIFKPITNEATQAVRAVSQAPGAIANITHQAGQGLANLPFPTASGITQGINQPNTRVTLGQVAAQLPQAALQTVGGITGLSTIVSHAKADALAHRNPITGFGGAIGDIGKGFAQTAADLPATAVATIRNKPVNIPVLGKYDTFGQQAHDQGVINPTLNAIMSAGMLVGGGKSVVEKAPGAITKLDHVSNAVADKIVGNSPAPVAGQKGVLGLSQDGYIATPNSVNFNKYVKQGKPVTNFQDGLKGVEISDKKMSVKPEAMPKLVKGQEVPLGDVIQHKNLEKDYPTFFGGGTGGVKVKLDPNHNARGSYNDFTNTISINPDILGNTPERMNKALQSDQGRKVIAHEVSHAIDSYSGVTGANPTDITMALRMKNSQHPTPQEVFNAYNATSPEQRALMGEDRINMSQRQLDKNPRGQQASPFRLPGTSQSNEFLAARNTPQPKGGDGKFVKGGEQPLTVYRGEQTGIGNRTFGGKIKIDPKTGLPQTLGGYTGIPTGKNIDYVNQRFGGSNSEVRQFVAKPTAKVLDDPQEILKLSGAKTPDTFFNRQSGIAPYNGKKVYQAAKAAGYDAVDLSKIESLVPNKQGIESEVRILNQDAFHPSSRVAQSTVGDKGNTMAAMRNPEDPKFKETLAPQKEQKGSAANVDPAKVKAFEKSLKESQPAQAEIAKGNKEALDRNIKAEGELGANTKKAIASAKEAPAPYSDLPAVKSTRDTVRNMDTVSQMIKNRTAKTATLADKVLGKSPENARLLGLALENPKAAYAMAKEAGIKDPGEFMHLVNSHRQLTDFNHSLRSGVGAPVNYVKNYFQHQWDLSDPKKAEEFVKLAQEKGKAANERVFNTIAEGEKAGFKLKPVSASEMIKDYGHNEASAVSKQALVSGLQGIRPNDIVDLNSNEGSLRQNGEAFKQLQVPGLENYHVSPALLKDLQGIQKYHQIALSRAADTINTGIKQVSLGLGGFHDLNETLRYASQELISARPSGFANLFKARQDFFSPKAHQARLDKWQKSGLLDFAAKSNLTGKQGADIHGLDFNIEKYNPMNKALFDREIQSYKLMTLESEAKRRGITDFNNLSDKQLAEGRALASQINNWYGGINLKVLNRNPIVQRVLRYTTLAPDFTEGKIRTVGNAAKLPVALAKGDAGGIAAGSLAARQLVGNAFTVALLATVVSRALGQQPQNFFKSLIDPQVKLPYKSPSGKDLVAKLPANPISDLYRLATDPAHFVQSHVAAAPSVLTSAISGKDYYGNDVVDHFKNPNPNFIQNLEGAIGSKVPIAVGQFNKMNAGKQNLQTTLINTLGGRVGNDPTSPANQQTTSYFNARDKFYKSLNPNDRALFDAINPQKKDAQGNPVYNQTPLDSPSDYAKLLANPDFLSKYKAYQQSQGSHDPLWNLNDSQLKAYMESQVISKFDPGGDKTTANQLRSQLPADFFTQRDAYFKSLPGGGATSSTQPQAPKMPSDVSSWYDNVYKNLSPTAKHAALQTPEGQKLTAYFNSSDQFTDQQRAALGLPPINHNLITIDTSKSSSGTKSSGGKKSTGGRKVSTRKAPKSFNYAKSIASTKSIGKLLGKATIKTPKLPTSTHTRVAKLPKITSPKIASAVKMPKAPKTPTQYRPRKRSQIA